jgi:hypothetical protein
MIFKFLLWSTMLFVLFSTAVYSKSDSLKVINSTLLTKNLDLESSVMKLDFSDDSMFRKNPPTYLNENVNFNPLHTEINYYLLGGIGTAFLGTGLIIHFYQQKAWWSTKRSSFHFENDWKYALWIDKIGHLYGASLLQHGLSAGLEAADFDAEMSTIYGSIGALAFQTYIEIEDGFGPNWGFSPGDFYSDILGAAFPIAQYYYPYLKNFQFRFSYVPKDLHKTNPNSGQQHIIIDDYAGQKFWVSCRMKNILPNSVSKYWPGFLMLSGGMGVRDLDGLGGGRREWYIGLDFDAEEIPLYGKFWQFIKNTLNYIHFPLPGFRFSPETKFFAFCF